MSHQTDDPNTFFSLPQLWWLTAPDWLSIDLLEEAQDTPAAWPLLLQWSLVRVCSSPAASGEKSDGDGCFGFVCFARSHASRSS